MSDARAGGGWPEGGRMSFQALVRSWICGLALLGVAWGRPLRVILLGDLQVHSRRTDPRTALAHLKPVLARADLVYANLEGVLVNSRGPQGDIPDKYGWTHPGVGALVALRDAGIGVVGLANNVAYGAQNILTTVRLLDGAGVAHTGAGRDLEAAHAPAILVRDGLRIGFLQYTARWYREEEQLAGRGRAGVAALHSRDGLTLDTGDAVRLRQDIRRLRPRVDLLIVSQHNRDGATAVQYGPRERRRDLRVPEGYQRQFAHLALDAGADLVFGHGTHCLQGVEIYHGRAILYAIGHSAFDQPGHEGDREGLLVEVSAGHRGVSGVRLRPLSRDGRNDVFLLDPGRGPGSEMVTLLRKLSPGVKLRVEGRELVLEGLRSGK